MRRAKGPNRCIPKCRRSGEIRRAAPCLRRVWVAPEVVGQVPRWRSKGFAKVQEKTGEPESDAQTTSRLVVEAFSQEPQLAEREESYGHWATLG